MSTTKRHRSSDETPPTRRREYVASLAKGLAVLGAFKSDRPTMSLSEAAAVAGLSRAAARRALITLTELGYLTQAGRDFTLAPRILELGFAYLSVQSWIERAEPLLRGLSQASGESCSAAILQDSEIVFVARAQTPHRLMVSTIAVGARLPAFHTALGRAQLGFLDDAEIWRRLRPCNIQAFTPQTIIDLSALVDRVKDDRRQGFSIVDEELERGLRAIAVPIARRNGDCVGAIDVSVHASRTTRNEMRSQLLPRLKGIAEEVAKYLP